MPELTINKCEWMGDWYLIERARHDGREWMEQIGPGITALRNSARISDADVEGPACEMLSIARAIRERRSVDFKRCSVEIDGDEARFCSPRNSRRDGIATLAEADDLADKIEAMLLPKEAPDGQ